MLNERETCGDVCRMRILHFARGAPDSTSASLVSAVQHQRRKKRNYYFEQEEVAMKWVDGGDVCEWVAVCFAQFSIRQLLISCIVVAPSHIKHRAPHERRGSFIIPFR